MLKKQVTMWTLLCVAIIHVEFLQFFDSHFRIDQIL